MSTVEDLRYGLNRLQTNGWVQHVYWNADLKFCMIGALPTTCDRNAAAVFLAKVIGDDGGLPLNWKQEMVFEFNDEPGRTFEEVEAVYVKAIALAEAS